MDSGTGSVYVIDITARKGNVFLDGLNNLSALAFDPNERKLYVAQRRVVTAINIDSPAERKTRNPGLKNITAIAVDPKHRLWVGDFADNKVLGPF